MLFTKSLFASPDGSGLETKITRELQEHRGKYLFQGILFILAGMFAAVFPVMTTFNIEFVVGFVLIFSGLFQCVMTLQSKMHWLAILSGILSVGMGVLLLWQPLPVLTGFVTLLAVFMSFEGLFEIFLSFQFRPSRRWHWMFFSGLVTLGLGAVLWIGSPIFDALYLGWMVALNLMFYGLSLLMLVQNTPAISSQA